MPLKKQATFFDRIMKDLRHDSEYFRVGFYGRGYPSFLQVIEIKGHHFVP